MQRRAATFLVGCALIVPLAGCGDDDAPIEPVSTDATTPGTGDVAQEEFIVSADARCAEANVAIANLSDVSGISEAVVSQELGITGGVLDGLRGIGKPEDPDGSLASFYSALEEQVRILEDQQGAVASGDTAAAKALEADLDAAAAEAGDAATQYGFEECGQSGSALRDDRTGTDVTPAPVAPTEPAPVAPAEPVPTTPAPVTPVEPTPPLEPPAPGGGATGGGTSPPSDGGGSSGGSGGISPG